MKKIISIVLAVVVIAAGIVFIPRLAHTCDDCGKFFIGTGYEPNIVSDLLSENEQIICRECAEKQHAVTVIIGKSVEDYKRKLFD